MAFTRQNIPESLRHDRRLLAKRGDTAAHYLKGEVTADHFVEGDVHRVNVPVLDLKVEPDAQSATDTQLLLGEDFIIYGRSGAWCWGEAVDDGYVGWVQQADLSKDRQTRDHCVSALSTFVYAEPELKAPPLKSLSLGSRLGKLDERMVRNTQYSLTSEGWIIAHHLAPVDEWVPDYVALAERFLDVPYLWAGRSGFGVDCSGIIQLTMQRAGFGVLRDTDMQEQTIGTPLELNDEFSGLQRGDLIFWVGHVGIMQDAHTLLHANGASMTVKSEPLIEAVERISTYYQKPRSARRP